LKVWIKREKPLKEELFHLTVDSVFIAPPAVFSEFEPFVVPLGVFSCYVVSSLAFGAS